MVLSGVSYRRAIQRTFLLLFLGFCCSFLRGQEMDVNGTMPEDYLPYLKSILETAVKQSPEVLRREIDIARSEARVIDADRERWPNAGGDFHYDNSETAVTNNQSTKSKNSGLFYSFGTNQALFAWGAIRHTGDVARLELAISQKEYAEAYRLLAAEIRSTYLELIWRRGRVEWSRAILARRQSDLASAKDRLAHGTGAQGEVDSRDIALTEAEVDLERATLELDGQRRRLGRLVGLKEIALDDIPKEIPAPKYDPALTDNLLAAVLRDGGTNSFRARVAEMKIREADLNYRIARVRLLPKFNAGISHTRESSTTASPNSISQTAITSETLQIRGSWTIFDGFATKAAKLMAKADRRASERELQVATETTMDEAQRLARLVTVDQHALKLADYRWIGADALVKRTQDEIKAGNAAPSDLEDARANLEAARYIQSQVRGTFLSDWAAFVSTVTDDPALRNLPPRYARDNQ